ncbi:MAG: SMP-30/gluconolactonase/LRE family protein, partial [Elusimicrobiota bacterium]
MKSERHWKLQSTVVLVAASVLWGARASALEFSSPQVLGSDGQWASADTAMLPSSPAGISHSARITAHDPAVGLRLSDARLRNIPGTLGLWHFDEGSGTAASEASGNGAAFTLQNGTGWAAGKVGEALSFDGIDDCAGAGGLLTGAPNNFTIEFWAYPAATRSATAESTSGYAGLSGQRYAIAPVHGGFVGADAGAGVSVGTDGISVFEHGHQYIPSLLVYNAAISGWTHIAVVYADKRPHLYVNGALVRTGLTSPRANVYPSAAVSGFSYYYGYYEGLLDEMRILNYSATAEQIHEDYARATVTAPGAAGAPLGAVAEHTRGLWQFDEGSGASAADSSGNGANGSLSGPPAWTDGLFGKALDFDSSSDYVSVPDIPMGSEWTIQAWTKFPLASNGSWRTLTQYGPNYHHILVRNDGLLGVYSAAFYSCNYDVDPLSGWHLLTAVGTGSQTLFYIDADHVGTSSVKLTQDVNYIGNAGGGTQNWGSVDSVRILDAARTPEEIAEDFADRPSETMVATGAPLGAVAGQTRGLWQFDEGTGTSVSDASGNGENGSLNGPPAWTEGLFGKALNFDSSSDYVSVPDVPMGSDWTIQAWTRFPLASHGSWRTLTQYGPNYHHVLVRNDGLLGVYSGAFYSCNYDVDPLSGWHLLTAVGTGGQTLFYIDADHVGTSSVKLTQDVNYIGNAGGGTQNWGIVDSFRILGAARSPAEIAQDFADFADFAIEAGGAFSARYTVDGGAHYAEVPDSGLSMEPASGGTTDKDPHYLTVAGITGLAPSETLNRIEFTATNNDGQTATESFALKAAAPPEAVTAVSVSVQGPGEATVSWTPRTEPNVGKYAVYRAAGDHPFASLTDPELTRVEPDVPHPGSSSNDAGPGLAPNTHYHWSVVSFDQSGVPGPFSDDPHAYTHANPPADLTVAPAGLTSLSVSWGDASNPGHTRYEVSYSKDGFAAHDVVAISFDDAHTAASATIDGLEPETEYSVRVRAVNGEGAETDPRAQSSAGVPTAFATAVGATPVPPQTPAGLQIVGASATSLEARWDASSGAESYTLQASVSPAFSGEVLSYASRTNAAKATYLSPDTQYHLRVIASNPFGQSGFSAPTSGYTPAQAPAPFYRFEDGQEEAAVLGQAGLDTVSRFGPSATSVYTPADIAFDSSGNLWVADGQHNRVTMFPPPHDGLRAATIVLGQEDLTSSTAGRDRDRLSMPMGLAFDPSGNLWVADRSNHRVLMFSPPFESGMDASVVLGQPDFTACCEATTRSGMNQPFDVAADASGNVWVADAYNNRVLEFTPPFSDGMDASLVLGQADFTSGGEARAGNRMRWAFQVAVDASGNVWVADNGNYRALMFSPPFADGMDAALVLGQGDFVVSNYYDNQTTMRCPLGIAFDPSGKVFLSDNITHRVLVFDPPLFNGMPATSVLGQTDFVSGAWGSGPASMTSPIGIAFHEGLLWVADWNNARLVAFAGALDDFPHLDAHALTVRWAAAGNPAGVQYLAQLSADPGFAGAPMESGWITDAGHAFAGLDSDTAYYARVKAKGQTAEETPFTDLGGATTLPPNTPPTAEAGADQTVTRGALVVVDGSGADADGDPVTLTWGVASAPQGSAPVVHQRPGETTAAFVADSAGIYMVRLTVSDGREGGTVEDTLELTVNALPPAADGAFQNGQEAGLVVGQPDFASYAGSSNPYSVAFDSAGNLWVSDWGKSEVLRYDAPLAGGMDASLVLGGFGYGGANRFFWPRGMAFDSTGRLWVVDNRDHRVLRFTPPFTDRMDADMVIGRADFGWGGAGGAPDQLSGPWGVAVDPDGNLWVADTGNYRVVRFKAPLSTGMSADVIIGGYGTTASTLYSPRGLAFDSEGNLWVAENDNRRVMRFSPPFASGMSADLVIGQDNFTSSVADTKASRFRYPRDVGFDAQGSLWVVEAENVGRALEFRPPFSNGMSASRVVGKADFTSTGETWPPTAASLNGCHGVAFDPQGNMAIADTNSRRVSYFLRPANNAPVADAGPDVELPQWAVATMDGSGSTDADGQPLSYTWTLAAKPAGSAVEGFTQTEVTVSSPSTSGDSGPYTDGYIRSESETSYRVDIGDASSLRLGNFGGQMVSHVYVGFDASFISPGASIVKATLKMYVWGGYLAEIGPAIVDLVDFGEALEFEDDSEPALVSNAATFLSEDYPAAGYHPVDVTEAVREALSSGLVPQFRIRAANEYAVGAQRLVYFSPSERSAAERPLLEITISPAWNRAQFQADAYGAYELQLTVSDGSLSSVDTAVVTAVRNDRPVADAQTAQAVRDGALPITLTASDREGAELGFAIVSPPSHGTLEGTPPNVTYLPAPGYLGADGFSFKVNDGVVDSDEAAVGISVVPLPEAPPALLAQLPPSGAAGMHGSYELAADRSGNWYVGQHSCCIMKYDIRGDLLLKWGAGGGGAGQFGTIGGMAFDSAGNVYVAGASNHRVQKFDAGGNFLMQWGAQGSGDGQFETPTGIGVDAAGNVYVLENAGQRVQKFSSGGGFLGKWSVGAGMQALGVDSTGGVFVLGGGSLLKYDSSGNQLAAWSLHGEDANGLAVDRFDRVYAAYRPVPAEDPVVRKIKRFTSDGLLSAEWRTDSDYVGNLAVDASGIVYAGHWHGEGKVVRYTAEGGLIDEFGGTSPGSLAGPSGVAVDASGNVYVADTNHNQVQKFDPAGRFVARWGREEGYSGGGDGQFNRPMDVAVDGSGNMYVVDFYNCRVQKFDAGGNFATKWGGGCGSGDTQFYLPSGIAVDAGGNVYVMDQYNNKVKKFDPNGNLLASWGAPGAGNGEFDRPERVAVDASGNIVVADTRNHRVQVFDPNGVFLSKWGVPGDRNGQLEYPAGLALDSSGNVYLTDAGNPLDPGQNNSRVQKFDAAGGLLTTWGTLGTDAGEFRYARDAAVGPDGRVYVADNENNRVQVFGAGAPPPVAHAQAVETQEDAAVAITLTGTGQGLAYTVVSGPEHGSLSGAAPNLSYTPQSGYYGFDAVVFKVSAGGVESAPAAAAIVVRNADDPPSFDAIADQASPMDGPAETVPIGGVSAGYNDPESVGMSAVSSDPSVVPHPVITGAGAVRSLSYQPAPGRSGTVTVTVTADDGRPPGDTFSRSFAITVYEAAPAAPSGLGIAGATATSLEAEWATSAGAETYTVEASVAAGFTGEVLSQLVETNRASVIGLSPDTLYYVRVKAANSGGESSFCAAASGTTSVYAPAPYYSFQTGQAAQAVLGQADASSNAAFGPSRASINSPVDMAFDASGNLWVVEMENHRILMFEPPHTGLRDATLVLGQAGFDFIDAGVSERRFWYPESIAFDPHGNLWVADRQNNRVLMFKPPFGTDMAASLVLGQDSFTTRSYVYGNDLSRMYQPAGVAADGAGNVFVADRHNSRVLLFSPPFSNGMAATRIIAHYEYVARPASLYYPNHVAVDRLGRLWVADYNHNRAVRFSPPFEDGMSADLVLGNPDLYASDYQTTRTATKKTWGIAIDPTGKVFVGDETNHRVMVFDPPLSDGMPAAAALGQADFTSGASGLGPDRLDDPRGAAFHDGTLWVADYNNRRLLAFAGTLDNFPYVNTFSLVVRWAAPGNPPGTQYLVELSDDPGFPAPLQSGWITDTSHTFPGLRKETAYHARVKAKGQMGVETTYTLLGGTTTRSDNAPPAADAGPDRTVDQGELVVVEGGGSDPDGDPVSIAGWEIVSSPGGGPVLHHRAGETAAAFVADSLGVYTLRLTVSDGREGGTDQDTVEITAHAPPAASHGAFQNGQDASVVLGAPDYAAFGSVNALRTLFDGSGNVWMSDGSKHRVLRYDAPLGTGAEPSLVLGQENLADGGSGLAADRLNSPNGMAFDPAGRLWVADSGNNRVLRFTPPFGDGMDADLVLGQAGFEANAAGSGAGELDGPRDVGFDGNGRLWLADTRNHRVLRFSPDPLQGFSSAMSAELVIGQSDFGLSGAGTTAGAMNSPRAVAFDASGDLWVSERDNHRILRFRPDPVNGFSTGMSADLVIGQDGFTSNTRYPYGPTRLSYPDAIAFDAEGSLWVAGSDHSRVFGFRPPFETGMAASRVLGRTEFNTTGCGRSQSRICEVYGVAFDRLGNLAVADTGNYRVMYFVRPPNIAPVADAGPDLELPQWAVAMVDGSGSYDAEERPISYTWSILTKPAGSAVSGFTQTENVISTPGASGPYLDGYIQFAGATPDGVNTGYTLFAGDFGGNRPVRSFMGFDVSFMPPGATVERAILKLYVSSAYDVDIGPVIVDLVDFGDTLELTDDAQPPVLAGVATFLGSAVRGGYTSLDVTAAVREALSRGLAPQFRIRATNEVSIPTQELVYIVPAEGDAAQRPRLEITVSPPVDKAQFQADAYGTYEVRLTVSDGWLSTDDTALVTAVRNDRPVADPQTAQAVQNGARQITLTGSDNEGAALAFAVVTQPSNGTLEGTPPGVTYLPALGYLGGDGFTFTVNDGVVDSVPAAVNISVVPPPESPPPFLAQIPRKAVKFSAFKIATDNAGNIYVGQNYCCVHKHDPAGNHLKTFGSFRYLGGVGVDSSGDYVYVSDRDNNRIIKYDSEGNQLLTWGSAGTGNGQFNGGPFGIDVGADGNVYVGEYAGGARIQKFDAQGQFLKSWAGGNYIQSVAVDSRNDVYATGVSMGINRFDSEGNLLASWAAPGGYPDLAVDRFSRVYVVARQGEWPYYSGVKKYSSTGQLLKEWDAFNDPATTVNDATADIHVGPSGIVYVPNYSLNTVRQWDTEGGFIEDWGGGVDGSLNAPNAVAMDSSGNIYVADTNNDRIQKFDPMGRFLAKWGKAGGGHGSGDGEFYRPIDVAVDAAGNIYVADFYNYRIQKLGPTGEFITKWGNNGSGDGQFSLPSGLAVDSANNVYVADRNNRVQKFDSNGTFLLKWGSSGTGDGQFNEPKRIAVNASGNIVVSDPRNNRVQMFDPNGTFLGKWDSYGSRKGQIKYPYGVGTDSSGNVFITEPRNPYNPSDNNARVQKFDASGSHLTEWGGYGSGQGQFIDPLDVASGAGGRICVADAGNNRVQIFGSGVSFPAAEALSVQTQENTAVALTLRGTGQAPVYSVVSGPDHGSLSGTPPNLTYTPETGYYGFDYVRFKVSDGGLESDTALASIVVLNVNNPPFFDEIADQAAPMDGPEATVAITGVFAGYNDPETVSFSAVSSDPLIVPDPAITSSGDTRTLSYQPAAGRSGTVTITVTADDGQAQDSIFTRTFDITIYEGPPPAPTGLSASASGAGGLGFHWNAVASAQSYTLEVSASADFTGEVHTFRTDATSVDDGGFIPDTLYSARVQAVNSMGAGAFAGPASARTLASRPVPARSFETGQNADLVLGQVDFNTKEYCNVSNGQPATQTSMCGPIGVAFDTSGNLWVSDYFSNRVMRYDPLQAGGLQSASLVLGQPDFTSTGRGTDRRTFRNPYGIALDNAGNLWVADSENHRVLRFDRPFSTHMEASLVLGQADFTTTGAATTQSGFNRPIGVAVDASGRMWVADMMNNRVLRFSPPFSDHQAADLVLGQPDFTSSGVRHLGKDLYQPRGVSVDADGNIWVADGSHLRVLRFSPPSGNYEEPNLVLGKETFTSPFPTAPTQTNTYYTHSLAFDASGKAYVVDAGHHRVLVFEPPFSNGMPASTVLGQPDFQSEIYTTAQNRLDAPREMAFDGSGALWFADHSNRRVLSFEGTPDSFRDARSQRVTAAWGGNRNPPGTEYSAQLAADPGFASPMESGWITDLSHTFTGLDPETGYYARVKARNQDGIETPYTDLGGATTLPPNRPPTVDAGADQTVDVGDLVALSGTAFDEDPEDAVSYGWTLKDSAGDPVSVEGADTLTPSFTPQKADTYTAELAASDGKEDASDTALIHALGTFESADEVNGKPELSLTAALEIAISAVDTAGDGAYLLAASHSQDLFPVGRLYDVGPHGASLDPAGALRMCYDPQVLADNGVAAGEVFLYHYAEPAWQELSAALDEESGCLSAELSELASIFGLFAVDRTSPAVAAMVPAGALQNVASPQFALAFSDTGSGAAPATLTASLDGSPRDYFVLAEGAGSMTLLFGLGEEGQRIEGEPTAETTYAMAEGERAAAFEMADRTGNKGTASASVTIDMTPPTVVVSSAPGTGQDGWSNGDVAITLECSDNHGLPEPACADPQPVAGEGAELSFSTTVVDLAGNSASVTLEGIKIDRMLPAIAASSSAATGQDGWSNGDVTVTFVCSDDGSGLAEGACPGDVTVEGEGADLSASGEVADLAGNVASVTLEGIKIDRTAPSITASRSAATGQDGWSSGDVTVSFACSDNGSGLAEGACPGSETVEGEGADLSASGEVADLAGNSASATLEGIKIDRTPPVITASSAPGTGLEGWSNVDVEVRFECADGLSGLAGPCPVAVAVDGEGADLSASADDDDQDANNTASTNGVSIK